MGAVGDVDPNSIASTLICSSTSFQTDIASSLAPSLSKSARSNWVVGLCPEMEIEGEGLGLEMARSESDQLHSS